MIKSFGRFASILAVVAFSVGASVTLLASSPAGADPTTLVVNTTLDSGDLTADSITPSCAVDNVSTCTLREAISEASETSGDIVSIPTSGHYLVQNPDDELTVGGDGNDITITGAGQNSVFIDASCEGESCSPDIRVMKINTGAIATISGVTIEYGDPDSGIGGGILNCGTLTLNDSTVQNNVADDAGGGIDENQTATATLTDDIIQDNNTVDSPDGGEDASVGGGGIFVDGSGDATTMTITGSLIQENTSTADGAGIQIGGDDNIDDTVTIDSSTITNNEIDNSDLNGGGISVDSLSTLSVTNSTISNNSGADDDENIISDGGGVSLFDDELGGSATFTGDSITDNEAQDGGGFSVYDANLDLANSSVTLNNATQSGGGIFVDTGEEESPGNITVTGTTISNNKAEPPTDVVEAKGSTPAVTAHDFDGSGFGAGIYNSDCSEITATDDTISGNEAYGNDSEGGGYYASSDGCPGSEPTVKSSVRSLDESPHTTTFLYDTIDGNGSQSLADQGGNIALSDNSTVVTGETIVADGTPTDCDLNVDSTFTSTGYNLFDENTCETDAGSTGDIIGQSPNLAGLADNGGQTSGDPSDDSTLVDQTQAPNAGSPAINGVPASVCGPLGVTTDERGLPRSGNSGGDCTIGAYEPQVAPPPPVITYNPNGYRMGAVEGGVFDFGIQFGGALANDHLNAPIVGIANSPGPNGYLLVGADGGVFALGGASFHGSLGGHPLITPIAAIAATPDGGGYWLVSQAGSIFNFGDAPQLPSVTVPPGDRIVGIASTNDGQGVWLTDNAGDVYTQGDAQFLGSLGGKHLNDPIVGIAPAATGQGYILVASDGGAFAFGVTFQGSVPGVLKPGQALNAPIVGIAVTHSGNGYWIVGADGGVFCFGDAPFLGSTYTQLQPGQHLNGPIIGIQHLGNAVS